MPELDLSHIDQISRDVKRQNICFSHLMDELIDHLCCDVEDEMKLGSSFMEAYSRVRLKSGKGRLQEIQEETLYAVDTKYRRMKKTMKISGIAGTVLLSFASLFKIYHLPLAGMMMTLGALILVFVFLPSAMNVLWKETRSKGRLFLFASGFLAGSSLVFGILFKVQHWPGTAYLFLASISVGVLLFFPAVLILKLKDPEKEGKRSVYTIGLAATVLYLVGFWFRIMHWPFAWLLMTVGLFFLIIVILPWYTFTNWKSETHVTTKFIFMIVAPLLFIMPAGLVNLNVQNSYDDSYDLLLKRQKEVGTYLENRNNTSITLYKDSLQYEEMSYIDDETVKVLALVDKVIADQKLIVPVIDIEMYLNTVLSDYQKTLSSSNVEIGELLPLLSYSNYLGFQTQLSDGRWPTVVEHSMTLLKTGILKAESITLDKIVLN